MNKLEWLVVDLTNGKFDGFYAHEADANAVRDLLDEEFPYAKIIVCRVTNWGNENGAYLLDNVFIGANA